MERERYSFLSINARRDFEAIAEKIPESVLQRMSGNNPMVPFSGDLHKLVISMLSKVKQNGIHVFDEKGGTEVKFTVYPFKKKKAQGERKKKYLIVDSITQQVRLEKKGQVKFFFHLEQLRRISQSGSLVKLTFVTKENINIQGEDGDGTSSEELSRENAIVPTHSSLSPVVTSIPTFTPIGSHSSLSPVIHRLSTNCRSPQDLRKLIINMKNLRKPDDGEYCGDDCDSSSVNCGGEDSISEGGYAGVSTTNVCIEGGGERVGDDEKHKTSFPRRKKIGKRIKLKKKKRVGEENVYRLKCKMKNDAVTFQLCKFLRSLKFKDKPLQPFSLFVGTWNVGNASPYKQPLEKWIPRNQHHIYAIGAQECKYPLREGHGGGGSGGGDNSESEVSSESEVEEMEEANDSKETQQPSPPPVPPTLPSQQQQQQQQQQRHQHNQHNQLHQQLLQQQQQLHQQIQQQLQHLQQQPQHQVHMQQLQHLQPQMLQPLPVHQLHQPSPSPPPPPPPPHPIPHQPQILPPLQHQSQPSMLPRIQDPNSQIAVGILVLNYKKCAPSMSPYQPMKIELLDLHCPPLNENDDELESACQRFYSEMPK
eukprot:TRINITY_DN17006_c0_g5_i3.p1 TRINITY_DN17006_c0_g5~~TRINITY_DN17006_c0_g5_i3.p1  ORF type:complete len:592 (+),score=175.01 TRINITY_DN17006_c0_g5_i3:277-2052(+)